MCLRHTEIRESWKLKQSHGFPSFSACRPIMGKLLLRFMRPRARQRLAPASDLTMGMHHRTASGWLLSAQISAKKLHCAPQTQLQWGLHDLFDFGPINKESGTWPWNSFYTRSQRSILRWRLTGFPHEINTCHNTAMKKRREIHPRPWAIKIQEMNQHGDNPEFRLTSLPTSKYDKK